mgnify:CR=1 FL=1
MHTTTAPSREELIGRATELVPVLSKNALWQEENRVLHQDTIDALTESGLLRLTLPARYGGYEADTTTVPLEVVPERGGRPVTLAEGMHAIVLEYYQGGGGAGCQLRWQPAGKNKQAVPAAGAVRVRCGSGW